MRMLCSRATRTSQIRLRVPLLRVIQVREEARIADEEHGYVVAHEVPVALGCVELGREPANTMQRAC